MWLLIPVAFFVLRFFPKLWRKYRVWVPFMPKKWKVAWVLIKYQGLIRDAIQNDTNTTFYRKIEYLYPKLEGWGIRMLKVRPFINSDRWRNYHVGLLKDLYLQIRKIEDGVYLDLERWNTTAALREEARDVIIFPNKNKKNT